MGCGCKRRNQTPPVETPAPVSIKLVEVQDTNQQNLNENQQNLINQIVDKINQSK